MGGLKNASFTDLAEMVCRIEEPSRTYFTDSKLGYHSLPMQVFGYFFIHL